MWRTLLLLLMGAGAQIIASQASAAFPDDLRGIAQQWASARYELSGEARKVKMREVIKAADAFVLKYPDEAESHLWAGVVHCSLAEIESKLTALGLVKECRAKLEKSLALDPNVEDGYAYGVLGTLYARVPGWPLSFGDKKKADQLLLQGVTIAPTGMNTNYFYAKFLYDQGDISRAREYCARAVSAPLPYPVEQSLPVAIRQREIRELDEHLKAAAP